MKDFSILYILILHPVTSLQNCMPWRVPCDRAVISGAPPSHIRYQVRVLATLFPIQIPTVQEAVREGLSTWVVSTHLEEQMGPQPPGCSGLALAENWADRSSLHSNSLPFLPLSLPFEQTKVSKQNPGQKKIINQLTNKYDLLSKNLQGLIIWFEIYLGKWHCK